MGYSSYSDDFYKDRVVTRAATSTPTFKHDADVKSGKVSTALNPLLDINGKIRESRDSAEHPNSTAIAVFCDVTGSMSRVPSIVQGAIPQLMGLLLRKAYMAALQGPDSDLRDAVFDTLRKASLRMTARLAGFKESFS